MGCGEPGWPAPRAFPYFSLLSVTFQNKRIFLLKQTHLKLAKNAHLFPQQLSEDCKPMTLHEMGEADLVHGEISMGASVLPIPFHLPKFIDALSPCTWREVLCDICVACA